MEVDGQRAVASKMICALFFTALLSGAAAAQNNCENSGLSFSIPDAKTYWFWQSFHHLKIIKNGQTVGEVEVSFPSNGIVAEYADKIYRMDGALIVDGIRVDYSRISAAPKDSYVYDFLMSGSDENNGTSVFDNQTQQTVLHAGVISEGVLKANFRIDFNTHVPFDAQITDLVCMLHAPNVREALK